MEAESNRPLQRWLAITQIVLVFVVVLLVIPLLVMMRPSRQVDQRLIGTWQSDADRTIDGMLGTPPSDPDRAVKLRNLFGKLRVTYTSTSYTTELDGAIESHPYDVIGRDKVSAVIRDLETKPSPLDELGLELSKFQVIHFDGPDAYWLHTEIGGIQEYFKRIK